MFLDIAILIYAIVSLFRGREIGFLRQLFSTIGFFVGLYIGSLIEPHTILLVHTTSSRAIVAILTTLGGAFVFLTIGEFIGVKLKHIVLLKRINSIDNALGAGLSVVSMLLSVWLIASILHTVPLPQVQRQLNTSKVVAELNKLLPPAPTVISGLTKLVDPNGFPKVFIGGEPKPMQTIYLPNLGALKPAVLADRGSVLKVHGQGCGGIVEGSGFIVGNGLIATNAHVVAGIRHPYVDDSNGSHPATPIWFDPNLDFAVLRVKGLTGKILPITPGEAASGTPAAVLGYPGGGPFMADPAAIMDSFLATGRNIYGTGDTQRNVYELKATVIPGNSGGPLVAENGSVLGIVFAQSTTYKQVGYALETNQVITELAHAEARNQPVTTGNCAQ